MARPIRPTQISKIINKLVFAKRFLVMAMLVQVTFLLPPNIRSQIGFGFVCFSSAAFGIIGFLIAYVVLDLKAEAQEDSIVLLGPRLQAGLIFGFIMAFFVPIVNLTIIIWAYVKSASAIRKLEQLRSEASAKEKQRASLRGGVSKTLQDLSWEEQARNPE